MIAALAMLLSSAASGGSADAMWQACIARTTTNPEWAQCGSAHVERQDAALNAEWKRLMTAAGGKTKVDLIAEQRGWLIYRKHACSFYANGDWGREGQVVHYLGCVADMLHARTKELAAYRTFISQK